MSYTPQEVCSLCGKTNRSHCVDDSCPDPSQPNGWSKKNKFTPAQKHTGKAPLDDPSKLGYHRMPINTESASPDHYRKGGHECIDICRAVLGDEAFVSGCRMIMLQYLWRLGEKDESVKEARKIETYARWMKETLEGKPLSK